ncbi:conserved hypothetical protein [Verticillium alfalfae VaMs.102]|uniref:Uncharacterized protein n=1 Tax=Verticillium alfalfae (strain VaMs.102 / ATCC MYA-4576 / FGSC 10136) TaxID=526221 RepID=C9SD28_VERA1|nr:conserved hypothetical protein [Verticillium alfalfae VaMs.102]EEY16993.1 conserved hypothetical protein [Verticillium alfalfae VaMs.102]
MALRCLSQTTKSSSTSDRIREQAGASLARQEPSRRSFAQQGSLWCATAVGPRIYDYAAASLPPDDQSIGPFPTKGSWVLSLYQPFARPTATRKPILDAAWISHGRAVFALLADGSWGIWDIEGASPLGSTLLGKQSSGIQGAALTAFSVFGQIEGTSPLRNAVNGARSSGDFVPLTPHSRRDAAASLNAVTTPEKLASIKGGVTVTPLPTRGSQSGDESVVVWIGGHDNVSVIPAVSRFWDAQLRRSSGGGVNLFSGTTPTRMVRLQDLATGLLGERCCGVSAAVDFEKLHENDGGLRIEVLIQGESRLVIVRESEEGVGTKVCAASSGFGFNLDAAADVEEDVERDVEAEMLDIMEIDRALDSLDDDRGSGRKKVFFEDQFT